MGSWLQSAACTDADPDLFFPVSTVGRSRRQIAGAQAVCRRCPVLESCRTWALANPQLAEFGVWGGMTERERRTARMKEARLSGRGRPQDRTGLGRAVKSSEDLERSGAGPRSGR